MAGRHQRRRQNDEDDDERRVAEADKESQLLWQFRHVVCRGNKCSRASAPQTRKRGAEVSRETAGKEARERREREREERCSLAGMRVAHLAQQRLQQNRIEKETEKGIQRKRIE